MLIKVCSAQNERHLKSPDGDTEVVFVFDDEAIFQYRTRAIDGVTYRFDLVKAKVGDTPDEGSAVGAEVVGALVDEVSKGCWIETKSGKKLLLLGYEPIRNKDLSFDELAKIISERERVYWLLGNDKLTKARDLEALAAAVPEAKDGIAGSKMIEASALFKQSTESSQRLSPK